MKKLLCLLLLPVFATSQVTESSFRVPSMNYLRGYFGTSNRLTATTSTNSYIACDDCIVDNINVFQGAGTRKWKRVVDWRMNNRIDSIVNAMKNMPVIDGYTRGQVDSAIVANKVTWNTLQGKPVLFSGSYADLTNKPDLSIYLTSVPPQSWASITGKPTFFSGSYNDLTNKPSESDPVWSAASTNYYNKTQADARYLQTVTWSQVSGKPALFSGSYNDLTDKPVSVGEADPIYTAGIVNYYTKSASDARYMQSVSWSQVSSKPTFATVATTGSYSDLTGLPTIPSVTGLLSASTAAATYYPLTGNPSGFLTTANISGKLNTSDTVTMLAPYQRKSDAVPVISTVTRSLNTGYQISTTRPSRVTYTVALTYVLSVVQLSASAVVYLEISPNNSIWTTVNAAGENMTVGLNIGLNATKYFNLQCDVPVGHYVRLRPVVSGGGTAAWSSGQETVY